MGLAPVVGGEPMAQDMLDEMAGTMALVIGHLPDRRH
jgi:hypothetical protein